ncbi:hypothetical protein ES692_10635 [Psychroserpens burtonensis]|uniref:Glycosyltransferase family 2 protein n=1 Tax=Psychroserpens burtonensis TaxID=49278 RepID=A0A5C7B7J5_9FLAO|nr:hypothetical protein [Psychroserpens burtonensis]TXE17106.1 hypothetical protein ES692_10635 [Psychroserpens burtonensis]
MIHIIYNYFLTREPSKKANKIILWLRWQIYKYLKKVLPHYYRNLSIQKLGINSRSEIVVSLTSYPERIPVIYLSIKSILYQSYRPSKVILWLGLEQFPNQEKDLPKSLLDLKEVGLEIEFCMDLKPHTKYYYVFKKYPKQLIVTVDDDWFYPVEMLETLLEHHKKNPHCVIANRVREIEITDGKFKVYRSWRINEIGHSLPSHTLLATGVGGVLYNPSWFDEQLFDVKNIKRLALNADDIWLKGNEVRCDIPVVFTNRYFSSFMEIPNSQNKSLYSSNVFEGKNDTQIMDTFAFFGIDEKSFNRFVK